MNAYIIQVPSDLDSAIDAYVETADSAAQWGVTYLIMGASLFAVASLIAYIIWSGH